MRRLLPIVLVLFASQVFGQLEPFEKTIADLRKKAEAGDVDAQVNLGFTYKYGEFGLLKDYKEAVKWFRKAAEQGHAKAQDVLGVMYHSGLGVPKDNVAAYAWFNLASLKLPQDVKKRDAIAKKMTPEQIAKAQELSKELLKKIEANKK